MPDLLLTWTMRGRSMTEIACTNRLACNDYRAAYASGKDACPKCGRDLLVDRKITTLVDKHLDPIIDKIGGQEAATVGEWITVAIMAVRDDMIHAGITPVSPGEAGLAVTYRLLTRVSVLETAVRVAAYQSGKRSE